MEGSGRGLTSGIIPVMFLEGVEGNYRKDGLQV
jgi:hypothetical protein